MNWPPVVTSIVKELTTVARTNKATVAAMKSNGHILESQQIKTFQTAREELAATVESQEQDLVKIEGRQHAFAKKAKEEEKSAPKNKRGKGKKNKSMEVDDTNPMVMRWWSKSNGTSDLLCNSDA
ncbi:hypothetical protein JB92DRAFT_2837594 [Gautieria morchelliformis]|nr:hypothetical protein JB92DRAFT_2837594 [Gautieria morchelliformis]